MAVICGVFGWHRPCTTRGMNRMREIAIRGTRVVTYLLVLAGATGMIGTRLVRAEASDAAMGIGEKMLGLDLGENARELVINGQRLRMSSAVTKMPLGQVLDRLTDACREDADGLGTSLVDLPRALGPHTPSHAGIGLLRDERKDRGVVSCFATGDDASVSSLRTRLEKFTQSHDLADVGHLRYMAARTLPSGETHVIATWSEGPLALDALFPKTNEAPGNDPAAAPRPANARRVLSLNAAPSPYGVFVYEGSSAEAYDAQLRAAGYIRYEGTNAYRRGNIDLLIATSEGQLSVVEMSSRTVVAK